MRELNPTNARENPLFFGAYLKEASEDVKLEHRNVVVAGQVNGGLEGHGLQARADGMHFVKALSEDFPRHYCPERQKKHGHKCKDKLRRQIHRLKNKLKWVMVHLNANHIYTV